VGRDAGEEGPAREPVVVAHGLWMQGPDTYLLRRWLNARGFRARSFRYSSVREDLDENAARLARFAAGIRGDTVHFVGHSLGGVLILWMLEHVGFERTGRVVCLGAPLRGCQMAVAFGRWPAGRRMLGKSIAGLLARGGLARWSGEPEVGLLAGSRPLGLSRLVRTLPGTSDGVVTVRETRLEGAADHIVLPVSHMGMLISRETVEQTAHFLEHGRFRHG
jgi:pimeloyl-ACP methyl ester carboxylesterase